MRHISRSATALGVALLAAAPSQARPWMAAPGLAAPRPEAAMRPAQLRMDLNLRWAGSWVWTRSGQSNNVSTFEIRPNDRGAYCYDRDCRTVPYRHANGTITFSRNGTDHVELRAAEGGEVLLGRYWFRAADRNGPPAATIRMVKPPR